MSADTLSLFHGELAEFLQREVGEPLPLNEIIYRYDRLFGLNGFLEKVVMDAFPLADFTALGLARYYPRIYRGLPRLYHRDDPSRSFIKKNFSHLPSLKKQAATRALFSLYSKYPAKGKVTIFTWVIADGLGDYMAAVDARRIIKARFPDLEVDFVALVPAKMAPYLTIGHIIPYTDELAVPPDALALLRSSDFVLQMPTYYPYTETLQLPRMEKVGEYGFVESSWFHPKSGGLFDGTSFLREGGFNSEIKACQLGRR